MILAQQWFGITSRPLVSVIVFLIGLPPILAAYRVIANQHRARVFIGSWLLALPVLMGLLISNAILFGPNGNEIQSDLLFGMPLIVLVVDLIAFVLLITRVVRYSQLVEETRL